MPRRVVRRSGQKKTPVVTGVDKITINKKT